MTPPFDLNPTAIASIFGRPSAVLKALRLDRLTPVERILALAFTYTVLLILATSLEGTFFLSDRSALSVGLLNDPWKPQQALSLPLQSDPVSLLAIASAFLTPFFCFRQAEAMEEMVSVHKSNIVYRDCDVDWGSVDRATVLANRRFRAIGTKLGSVLCLAVAMALVLPLLHLVREVGPLAEFRADGVSAQEWHEAVQEAWWANSLDRHPLGSLMLDACGVLLYYAVVKQLAMGVVFTTWVKAITNAKFGVFPDLAFNSDGYWGMRVVRRLFQWTYASAVLHLTLSLLVLALWLPVGQVSLAIAVLIVVLDGLFVVYPTMTTLRGVTTERRAYVRYLRDQGGTDIAKDVDEVWGRPMLPFRLRSSTSAVFLYLLIPTAVAVLGSWLGK